MLGQRPPVVGSRVVRARAGGSGVAKVGRGGEHARRLRAASGEEGHSRRRAARELAVGAVEDGGGTGERVEVRRGHVLTPVRRQLVSEVVGDDVEEVAPHF